MQEKLRSLAGEAWRTTERVSAKGRIEHVERRYRLTLSVRDGATVKERTIESDSCVDLGGAAAVTLGLLLGRGPNSGGTDADHAAATATSGGGTSGDSATGARGSGAAPSGDANDRTSSAAAAAAAASKANSSSTNEPTTKSPDADAGRGDDDAANRSDDESTRTWRALLRAPLLTLDLFRLPKPSVGIGAGIGVRYAEWRFVVIGRTLSDQTVWSEQFPDVGTRVSRLAAELSACRGWRNGALEVSPCLTVGLDHLTVRGEGPPNIARHTRRTMAALIGGSGNAHLYLAEWMAIFAGVGVAVATSHPTFSVEDLGEIGHVGAVQVSIGVGPEWIF